jgi:hypothetical protein
VKSTEQEFVPDPGRVQVPPEENVPVPPENVTVPPGRMAVPEPVSETVAVQVVESPTGTEAGEQFTVVEVERLLTVRAKSPWLPLWSASPP